MLLWGRTTSINVQKVMWLLEEMRLGYDRVDVGGAFGGLDKPDYRALNPSGRIPTLADGSTVVWESNAILRYLSASYGQETFWGADPAERARADMWMEWFQNGVYADFITAFYQSVRLPTADRDPARLEAAATRLGEQYTLLDRELQGRPFLAGDRLTIGDIPAGASLYRYFEMEIERPALPALSAYFDRLAERPAYRDTIMTSFDALRAKE